MTTFLRCCVVVFVIMWHDWCTQPYFKDFKLQPGSNAGRPLRTLGEATDHGEKDLRVVFDMVPKDSVKTGGRRSHFVCARTMSRVVPHGLQRFQPLVAVCCCRNVFNSCWARENVR